MAAFTARTPIPAESPLAELEFVAFDTETTGCSADSGRMVEIGAVRFRLDGSEVDRFSRLVNPLRPIPASVTRIHGITDTMVRDCPAEEDVLPEFLSFLGDPQRTVLMAHNARFDMGFVDPALRRCRLTAPPHAVIDTVRLSRRRARGLPSHSLRSLVRCFGIGDTTEHRGLADSVALMRIFLHLAAKPPALMTAGDLFAHVPAWFLGAERSRSRSRSEAFRSRRPFWRPQPLAAPNRQDFAGEFGRTPSEANVSATEISTGESLSGEQFGREPGQLAEAIARGHTVSLIYDGGRSAGQRRSVTPLKIIVATDVTYLLAFCHVERKQKQYRLDRIRELVVEQ